MSQEHVVTIYGTQVLVCAPDGLPLDAEGAATDLIGQALGERADFVVIPAERLTDDFFELSTGTAEEIARKFGNYHLRLAIIGDIGSRTGDSVSLRAWVAESNSGTQVWFAPTFDDFTARLDRRAKPRP